MLLELFLYGNGYLNVLYSYLLYIRESIIEQAQRKKQFVLSYQFVLNLTPRL